MLNLTKPIAFIDLETTGLSLSKDRIVEIAILKVMPNGEKHSYTKRINPEMPIPEASSAVHGITNEAVADAPNFKAVAGEIKTFIDNCDIAGYNSNKFDIPLLNEEYKRVEIEMDFRARRFVDVQQIFMKMERRTLEAAYKFYCDKELVNSHSAEADVTATYEVLLSQLERYSELENDVTFLEQFTKGEEFMDFSRRIKMINSEPCFNFGKYKEQTVVSVFTKEKQYYDWIMRGDFAQDTKDAFTKIYNDMKLGRLMSK